MRNGFARPSGLIAGLTLAGLCFTAPALLHGQNAPASQPAQPAGSTQAAQEGLDYTSEAAGADGDEPARRLVSWNEYDGTLLSVRFGGGFLYDYAAYAQDAESKEQLALSPASGVRDFRLLAKGKFKFLPERVSYTIGYMYDGAAKSWRFRQTGFQIEVPEAWGSLFIGRTKEGFSTNKIMVGYQGWTQERSTASDAFIPILADGLKWTGGIPSGKFVYNVGFFRDDFSETESFNRNDNQFAARAVWLPFTGDGTDTVLHLAVEERYGQSDDGSLRFRSKPESFLAQSYAIDTGSFPASHSNMIGVESYYRPGPLTIGMEYYFNQVASQQTNDPLFHGGEIFAAYLLTGETRPYNVRGAYFDRISPKGPVFSGGPGAWELVLRFSYTDLDSGTIQGGKFWRITPMANWYLSDNVRLEFTYGYGELERFGLRGGTQFFQTRLQLQL